MFGSAEKYTLQNTYCAVGIASSALALLAGSKVWSPNNLAGSKAIFTEKYWICTSINRSFWVQNTTVFLTHFNPLLVTLKLKVQINVFVADPNHFESAD